MHKAFSFASIALFLIGIDPSYAIGGCKQVFHRVANFVAIKRAPLSPKKLWQKLRKEKKLISQEIDGVTVGGCGIACIINIAQAALAVSGSRYLENPKEIFENTYRKLGGNIGFPTTEMVPLLADILRQNGLEFEISNVVMVDSIAGPGVVQQKFLGPSQFLPDAKILKFFVYLEVGKSNELVSNSSHVGIVGYVEGETYHIIEPVNPYVDIAVSAPNFIDFPPKNFGDHPARVPRFTYVSALGLDGVDALVPVSLVTVEIK